MLDLVKRSKDEYMALMAEQKDKLAKELDHRLLIYEAIVALRRSSS